MSIEAVTEYLARWGAEGKIRQFEVSSATVALAAQALGCEEARIAKTMSFLVADRAVLIVTAGDTKVNSAKFKARFGVSMHAYRSSRSRQAFPSVIPPGGT